MDSSTLALISFVIITLIYFSFKYSMPNQLPIIRTVYFLVVIVSQLILNLSSIKELCKNTALATMPLAIKVTILPWLLIFGLLYVLLETFPGWKAPFSNTIGYFVVNIAGIKSSLEALLPSEEKKGVIDKLYSDKSLLVNLFTPENIKELSGSIFGKTSGPAYDQFEKLIRLKDEVAECIWYILTGALVTSIEGNAIVNSGCAPAPLDPSVAAEAQKAVCPAGKNEQRVYTTKE